MVDHTRRSVLKGSGIALGGLAATGSVTASTSDERFLVEAKPGDNLSGLEIVHDLRDAVRLAVVKGDADILDARKLDYAPDTVYHRDLPVSPVQADSTNEATDEPLYGLQWDKQVTNVPEAHEVTRGAGARVAVIDSGVAAGHPDLQHAVNVDLSRNFTGDDYGAGGPYGGYHGTHVAGIIAADDQNDVGVVGTAPGAEIIDCRVFSQTDGASFANILAAVVYSASIGCDVANLSLGAYPVSRKAIGSFYGTVLNRVFAYARRNGTLLIVAAGNDAADLQHDGRVCADFDGDGEIECAPAISLPNEAANVMSISATGPVGFNWGDDGVEAPATTPANYTNYGTNAISLSAPGGNYDPAFPSGWYYDLVLNAVAVPEYDDEGTYRGASYDYSWVAGTSMAAPQVAGAAALVASQNLDYSANKVRSALLGGANKMDANEYHGRGFLDAAGALE